MNAWLSAGGIEARGETVPLAAVPPLLLSTDQTTPEFEGSLNTVAVNCTVCKVTS